MDKSIKGAAGKFAAELMETDVFKDYYSKKASFNEDNKAQELVLEFNSLRGELMEKQQKGDLAQEDMAKLRQVQKELQPLESFQKVNMAQRQLTGLIQEASKELSAHLGFDFGDFAKPSGGCC